MADQEDRERESRETPVTKFEEIRLEEETDAGAGSGPPAEVGERPAVGRSPFALRAGPERVAVRQVCRNRVP
jgi:hypothetical protein